MPDPIMLMRIGPEHSSKWWVEHNPKGDCKECGSDCDGEECGLHAAGCFFGGFAKTYWVYAEGCPRFHGEVEL